MMDKQNAGKDVKAGEALAGVTGEALAGAVGEVIVDEVVAAKAKPKNGNANAGNLIVKTRAGVERFCRGGVCFTATPATVSSGSFSDAQFLVSDDQLAAIKAEPNLVVVEA